MNFVSLPDRSLILASGSATRQTMLANAGIDFTVDPAAIDEAAIKRAGIAENIDPVDIAVMLAEMKATTIARKYGVGHFVLGSDQLLVCDGQIFSKPTDRAMASKQLLQLSGKTHKLITAAMIFRDGERIWHHVETPELTMRRLDADFITSYLDKLGDAAFYSPGSYQVEGLGSHLFTRISGCHYSVLGLPLLQLLGFLREHGLNPATSDHQPAFENLD